MGKFEKAIRRRLIGNGLQVVGPLAIRSGLGLRLVFLSQSLEKQQPDSKEHDENEGDGRAGASGLDGPRIARARPGNAGGRPYGIVAKIHTQALGSYARRDTRAADIYPYAGEDTKAFVEPKAHGWNLAPHQCGLGLGGGFVTRLPSLPE